MMDPETSRIQLKQTATALRLLGLITIVVGLYIWVIPGDSWTEIWHQHALGAVFCITGLVLMGWFRRTTIDNRDRTAVRRAGIFVPMTQRAFDLRQSKSVVLDSYARRSNRSERTKGYRIKAYSITYTVSLSGVSDARRIDRDRFREQKLNEVLSGLSESQAALSREFAKRRLGGTNAIVLVKTYDAVAARRAAERVAKHLSLSIEDHIDGKTLRSHEELDDSVLERARKDGTLGSTSPTQPENSKIIIAEGERKKEFRLPTTHRPRIGIAGVLILFLFWSLFDAPSIPMLGGLQSAYVDVFAPLVGAAALWKLSAALACIVGVWFLLSLASYSLVIDGRALCVEKRIPYLPIKTRRTRCFAFTELEELYVFEGRLAWAQRKLIAVSDKQRVTIWIGNLPPDDANFLRQSLLYEMASRQKMAS